MSPNRESYNAYAYHSVYHTEYIEQTEVGMMYYGLDVLTVPVRRSAVSVSSLDQHIVPIAGQTNIASV